MRLPEVVLESVSASTADAQKNANRSPYVEVKGVIGTSIRFELLLPNDWNGRFVMGGVHASGIPVDSVISIRKEVMEKCLPA